MRQSDRLILNASVNVASGLANMAVRLLVVPLTVYYIGKEAYGVYALVAGLTLYTPYLHMGMASAVARYSAVHLARREYDELNAVVNTGIAYFRVAALLFIALALLIAFFWIDRFVSDPEFHAVARFCVVIFGVIEGGTMLLGPVSGVLWAIERFDLFSLPVPVFRIVRLAALAAILPNCNSKTGLVVVTVVMVMTNFLPALVRRIFVGRHTPNLRFSMRLARLRLVWPLMSFGIGSVTWNWALLMLNYLPLLIIGRHFTTGQIAEYEIPCSALLLVNMLVQEVTSVFLPRSSKLDAMGQRGDLRVLFLRTSKYAAGASWVGCAGMAILAPLLLYLWVGEEFLDVALVLTLLAAGRILFFVQLPTWYVLVGMAKQRVPAVIALVFVGVMGIGQWLALGHTDWGLVGVAGVTAVVLAIGWGVAIPIYACRQLDVGLRQYYSTTLIRPALACVPAALAWFALRQMPFDHAWAILGAALLSGVVCCGIGWWFVLFDDWDRGVAKEKLTALGRRIRSLRGGQAAEVASTRPRDPDER
jgi:O-antigen/teichoic acid export membrane protein